MRQGDRPGVGEHVGGVGEQRQGGGEDSHHHLHGHEGQDQRKRDPQPPAIGVRPRAVGGSMEVEVMSAHPWDGRTLSCRFERVAGG